jgi:hypothetical protein
MRTYQASDKEDFFFRAGQKAALKRGDGLKEGLENTLLFAVPTHFHAFVHQHMTGK